MNPRVEALKAKHPELFKDGPRAGFWIGDGWMTMVETLCAVIDHYIKNRVPEELRGDLYVAQVKEKFGGLAFYMNASTPFIEGAIAQAEIMSYHICEDCGLPGRKRNGTYIRTLCDTHHENEEARRRELITKFEDKDAAKNAIIGSIKKRP